MDIKIGTARDALVAIGAAGALLMSGSNFVQKVNDVPRQKKEIKSLKKRVFSIEAKQDYMVQWVESRSGKKYVQPVMRDDDEE